MYHRTFLGGYSFTPNLTKKKEEEVRCYIGAIFVHLILPKTQV